jgi:hypothetical protein
MQGFCQNSQHLFLCEISGFGAVSTKMAVFWVVTPCGLVWVYRRFRSPYSNIGKMLMQAASTSETSVKLYQTTRRYNPEHGHLILLRL